MPDEKINSPASATSAPVSATILIGSLTCAVISLVSLIFLSEEMFEGDTLRFDMQVRSWVHSYSSPTLTSLMTGITQLGSPLTLGIAFVFLLILFWKNKWPRAAEWMAVAMAGTALLDLSLKHAMHRVRPVPFFGVAPISYSFPSGHALSSFCFYGVLAGLVAARIRKPFFRAAVWILAASLVAAIGLSRVYLGVHYPTDVLAGYSAGTLWVSALLYVDRRQRRSE